MSSADDLYIGVSNAYHDGLGEAEVREQFENAVSLFVWPEAKDEDASE